MRAETGSKKGLGSPFFKQAIARMLKHCDDMEERLVEHPWL